MSQELDIEVQISSVQQITSGITTITPESIGAVPIGQYGKISSSYLPDQASLDTEVDTKITTHSDDTTNVHGIADTAELATKTYADGARLKAGVQWTNRHIQALGNPYLVGSIVYHAGRVYRCLATNDSIEPSIGGSVYWADLGVGYLLPNENPKIVGGSIDTTAGISGNAVGSSGGSGGTIEQKGGNWSMGQVENGTDENGDPIMESVPKEGGNAGVILQNGANGGNYDIAGNGGCIYQNAFDGNSGGIINTQAGELGSGGAIITANGGGSIVMYGGSGQAGGSLTTYAGGGSIDTRAQGVIQLGFPQTRTTLTGTATTLRNISFPNASGTLALQGDAILRAVDFDLGRTTSPQTAQLTQLTGYEMKPYTDYMVADISVQIKSRYRTQPLTGNFYTTPALQAYPIENYNFGVTNTLALTANGSPYTHPIVGTYVKIDSEYVLIDQVFDLVNGARNIRVRRGQMGTSPNATHNAGGVFGIYESTALFSIPPAVSVYNNWFGNAVSSECSIGTRPLVGNFSRSQNTPTSSIASGRQCLTYTDNGGINIQLTTLGTYLQTTSTSAITNTATSIPVTANSAFNGTNFYARITSTNGTEVVYVLSGGGGANWSVLRGVFGTTAIAHALGATLSTNVGSNATNALLGDIYVRLVPILR